MIKEGLNIKIEETDEFPNHVILNIPINENGTGSADFSAEGFLESVIIPSNMISNPNILCMSVDEPQYVVFDLREFDTSLLPIRVSARDYKGAKIAGKEVKLYLSGNYTIRVKGAVPESIFQIRLLVK